VTELHLYADHGCPFAHRVAAFLSHIGMEFELHDCPIGFKPEGVERYSASKRIPLLVHGDLVLTESRVMLEYLAEYSGYEAAFPVELERRARNRLALALVDEYLSPRLYQPVTTETERVRLHEAFEVFDEALELDGDSLFAFAIAPMWLQLTWHRPRSAAVKAIKARAPLAQKLNALLEHPAVAATTPDMHRVRRDVRNAIANGLIAMEAR
jgi:glutathione S-transferase